MGKRDTKHCDRLAALGCIVCRREFDLFSPAQIHHIRADQGMSQRADDRDGIPLCPPHHQTGGHGVAIHAGQETFEARFGTEHELLAATLQLLEMT